ncbi:hypothetical protein BJ165DRAFT_1474700 [Panaeolus papilionaceus]|nr:hypothetical protein BJ165DRAFT_1474700 [Panaeolus papilionaceus]
MSTMSEQLPALPNPFTPLAFLPPELALQTTNSIYVLVGACAVFVWDILDNISNDYKLLTRYKISIPTILYMVSRLGSLALVLAGTLFVSAGITTDCNRFLKVVGALYPVTIPANSLLFLLRLRAIFDKNRVIVGFFALVWISLFSTSIAIPWGLEAINIGPTKYCLTFDVKGFVSTPTVIAFASDTLVLLAISWRLMTSSHISPQGIRGVKGMVLGDYLPSFSRALLQGGQRYYTVTVSLNLLTVIMLFVSSVPPVYRIMFVVPNVVLTNIMACRVFRDTKFGLMRDSLLATSAQMDSTRVLDSRPVRFNRDPNQTFEMSIGIQAQSPPDQLVVHIVKDIEYESHQAPKMYDGDSKGDQATGWAV